MQDRRIRERRVQDLKPVNYRWLGRGKVIYLERRRMPDRRLNNIQSEFIPLEEFYK